nr:shikimate dehydrogenase [Natronosporangium hydrolyticum]
MIVVRRRAAVLGKPVGHSLSPAIHNAGYAAAGLTDWTYAAIECDEPELAEWVGGLGAEWAGLSLTMPLKEVALRVADEASELAGALGAANTLVHLPDGRWRADNTDAPGIATAVGRSGPVSAVTVLGAGGTARAALGAAAQLNAGEVRVVARREAALAELAPVAARLGISLQPLPWSEAASAVAQADLVVSTLPAGVADSVADEAAWRRGATLLDVIYHPWPTRLAEVADAAGVRVVSGLELLLAQAVGQFEQFTGVPAPVEAMRAALTTAASTGS